MPSEKEIEAAEKVRWQPIETGDEFLAKQSQADILFDALQMTLERFNFSNEKEPCVRMARKVRNDYLDRKRKSGALMQMMTGIASDEDLAEAQERHSKRINDNIDVYKRLADR